MPSICQKRGTEHVVGLGIDLLVEGKLVNVTGGRIGPWYWAGIPREIDAPTEAVREGELLFVTDTDLRENEYAALFQRLEYRLDQLADRRDASYQRERFPRRVA